MRVLVVVVALGLACVSAQVTTRAGAVDSSDSTIYVGNTVDKKDFLKKVSKKLGSDTCFDIKPTNVGVVFKSAKRGVSFSRCGDGRDCWTLKDCDHRDTDEKLCFEPRECRDRLGANRCLRISSCQCFTGTYKLEPADVGFSLAPENYTSLTSQDKKNGLVGYPGVLKVDECFEPGSFNFAPCLPGDDDCLFFAQCQGAPGSQSCFRLLPSDFDYPTTTVEATTDSVFTTPDEITTA